MSTLAEKRVFTEQAETSRALVASSLGVVGVSVSGDLVGEFGVDHRCTARDVAARGGALAVATDDDVLVGSFNPTGHGPAAAVSLSDAGDGVAVLAAAPDGTVSRLPPGALDPDGGDDGSDPDGGAWTELGTVDDPRRTDGPLVAAGDGVHRATDGGLEYAGLDDAHDVAAGGVPLAAANGALYTLGNGWMRVLDGDFRAVATDAAGERALAATPDAVHSRADATAGWTAHEEAGAADVAVAGDLRVLVTGDGTVRVNRDGEWRGRALGLPDVAAVAVPDAGDPDGPGDGGGTAGRAGDADAPNSPE